MVGEMLPFPFLKAQTFSPCFSPTTFLPNCGVKMGLFISAKPFYNRYAAYVFRQHNPVSTKIPWQCIRHLYFIWISVLSFLGESVCVCVWRGGTPAWKIFPFCFICCAYERNLHNLLSWCNKQREALFGLTLGLSVRLIVLFITLFPSFHAL